MCGSSTAWLSGRTGNAHERLSRMLIAGEQSNPYERSLSGEFAAELVGEMREYKESESLAMRTLEIAEKHKFFAVIADCHLSIGRARAQLGRPTEGIALIRQGLAKLGEISQFVGASEYMSAPGQNRTQDRSGGPYGTARYMSALAEAQRRAGLLTDAFKSIERALRASAEVPLYRPESLRISGELRLENGQVELAEAQFREGLALARTKGAKVWELRATMSLARLLAKKRRRHEALAMLTEMYNWFTEGFDTVDLKEAKALLDDLSR